MSLLAACGNYMLFSLQQSWGADPNAFFFEKFLAVSQDGGVWNLGSINLSIAAAVAVIWLINWAITYGGVQQGIERTMKVLMPVLFILTVIIIVWALFLPGASKGIKHYITPDFNKITDLKVWIAAYGQIFFSLSLGFGIMIAYSSYLSRDANILRTA